MIRIDSPRTPKDLLAKVNRLFELSAHKIRSLEDSWRPAHGAPVFTVDGRYTARGWTEWTQGFQFGSALLQFDATGDARFLELGRARTVERMAPHLTHVGVHDHGFNNVSTYGALWRLAREGRIEASRLGAALLRARAARSAARCRRGAGRRCPTAATSIRSTARTRCSSTRSARCARWRSRTSLGHRLVEEQDAQISLLDAAGAARARDGDASTSTTGSGRDPYDVRGRVGAREPLQRRERHVSRPEHAAGLLAVQHLDARTGVGDARLRRAARVPRDAAPTTTLGASRRHADRRSRRSSTRRAPRATSISTSPPRGRHPLLGHRCARTRALGDWGSRAADPFNDHEPVDSSAAAIARAGPAAASAACSATRGEDGDRYTQAGLRVLDTLFDETGPYLSRDPAHQGLMLHSVYHWPNGWDHVPAGARTPRGESSQWGDYHAREAAST